MRLGEILVKQGKTTAAVVDAALEAQLADTPRQRLGEILVARGAVSELDVLAALAEQYRLPLLATIPDEALQPELVRNVPVEWARQHRMLPVRHAGRTAVLTCDPAQAVDADDLALLLQDELSPVLAPAREILRAIEKCYFQKDDSPGDFMDDMATPAGVPAAVSRADDLLLSPDAPVTKLVNLVLLDAVKSEASDVHIEPYENKLRVRYRVDGRLYDQPAPPKHLEAALISRLKVMGHLDIAERRLPQDGMARVRIGEREVDIRISTVPIAAGERMVLRLLNRDSAVLPLAELGMPEHITAGFRRLVRQTHGAIWVTGPTGSGKTTTLYAALRELDTAHLNVLTIEEPIEYQMPDIGQISVKPKIGLTFAQGLRHILRQDPDVILVGETRDLETAEIAVRASLTGHLVFSTLHTNDAVGALIRLIDMGIPPYLVSAATLAALAQRLARKLCPLCRQPAALTAADRDALGGLAARLEPHPLWRAAGCPACRGGYRGRTGLYEMLVMGDAVREAVRRGAEVRHIQAIASEQNMPGILDDALDKVRQGVTDVAEILDVCGVSGAA